MFNFFHFRHRKKGKFVKVFLAKLQNKRQRDTKTYQIT